MTVFCIGRAEVENAPIDALYCSTLYDDLNRAVADYKASGDTEIIRKAIDTRVARSLRSIPMAGECFLSRP